MKLTEWYSIHTCVFCDRHLSESFTCSICDDCRKKWNEECALYKGEQILLPLGCRSHSFVGGYVSEKSSPIQENSPYAQSSMCRELVLSLKEERRLNAINFIAWEMAQKLAENGLDFRRDSFICSVPRSPKKIRAYGFDQSELIAKKISFFTGIEYIPALVYKGSGREQKSLNAGQRFINAESSYSLDENCIPYIALKRCILVDDVLTTAATIQSCAAILLDNGIRCVDALTAAKTFGSK